MIINVMRLDLFQAVKMGQDMRHSVSEPEYKICYNPEHMLFTIINKRTGKAVLTGLPNAIFFEGEEKNVKDYLLNSAMGKLSAEKSHAGGSEEAPMEAEAQPKPVSGAKGFHKRQVQA